MFQKLECFRGDQGFALISTLWFVMILSVLGLGLLHLVKAPYRSVHNGIDRSQSFYALEGAAAQIFSEGQKKIDSYHTNLFGQKWTISIKPESAKLNLNRATEDHLLRLLEGQELAGLTPLKHKASSYQSGRDYYRTIPIKFSSGHKNADYLTVASPNIKPSPNYISQKLADILGIQKINDNEYLNRSRLSVYEVIVQGDDNQKMVYVMRGHLNNRLEDIKVIDQKLD